MAKGEVRRLVSGCERDVFTYCLYHSTFLRFDEGSAQRKKMKCASGVDPVGSLGSSRGESILDAGAVQKLEPTAEDSQITQAHEGLKC